MVTMGPVCLMKLTRIWKLIRTLAFFLDFFPSSFRPLEAEIDRLCTWWPWDQWALVLWQCAGVLLQYCCVRASHLWVINGWNLLEFSFQKFAGWVGGHFDYSVSPGPPFWVSDMEAEIGCLCTWWPWWPWDQCIWWNWPELIDLSINIMSVSWQRVIFCLLSALKSFRWVVVTWDYSFSSAPSLTELRAGAELDNWSQRNKFLNKEVKLWTVVSIQNCWL